MSPNFNIDDRLDEAWPRSVGVHMPLPLHERIDQLCELVYAARYARPSKKKMLAAIVLAAPTDPDELQKLIATYDGALVQDALVTATATDTVVVFPRRASGPRRRPIL